MMPLDPAVAFKQAFTEELDQHPDATWTVTGKRAKDLPDGEDAAWWLENGPTMVQNWIDWRAKSTWRPWTDPNGNLAIELPIEVTVGGELLRHFIDCIMATDGDNGRLIIVDWKTGTKLPDSTLQLGVYKVVVEAFYPGTKVAGGAYFMVRKGELTDVDPLRWATAPYIASLARQVHKARAAGIFLPRISPLCRSCKVGTFCAANKGAQAAVDPDFALMQ